MPLPDGTPTSSEVLARLYREHGPIHNASYDQTRAFAHSGAEAQSAFAKGTAGDPDCPLVELIRGDSVTPEAIDWLWDGHLAAGKLHIIAGAPGTGKTTLALAGAATLTTGGRWPDGTRAAVGDVLIWSGEDSVGDTLVPRLIAAGADMARVHFVQNVWNGGKQRPFDPATDFPALALAASRIANLRLMIVDPVVLAVAGDSHKNTETRRGLQPLVEFAERIGCALIGITHFTKGSQGRDPVERVTGSLAFGAAPRVVLATAKLQEDARSGRVLVRAKSNIGPDGGGFRYELRQIELASQHQRIIASRVEWCGAIDGTAREILATAELDADPEERAALVDASDWLHARIADAGGEMEMKDVIKEAERAGHKARTVQRAKSKAGVIARVTGFGRDKRSVWRLSDSSIVPIMPSKMAGTDGTNEGSGTNGEPADAAGEVF